MDETMFTFTAGDGTQIAAVRWSPEGSPRAIVQLAHGMGEHSLRYRRLAASLTDHGYVVYADDHRGHGRTAAGPDDLGHFGPGGWQGVVDDLGTLAALAREDHPGLPLVLLGCSMGSFALQCYVVDHSGELEGAVLSGTTALDVIAGALDPSRPADLTAFNAPFEPARTPYDWLSRDPDEVDAYIADPFCGFGVDGEALGGMIGWAGDLADPDRLAAIADDLPIYVLSGDADPLAGGGALVQMVVDRYREAGVADVELHLYPGARHEVFNETNRDEITDELLVWLDRVTLR